MQVHCFSCSIVKATNDTQCNQIHFYPPSSPRLATPFRHLESLYKAPDFTIVTLELVFLEVSGRSVDVWMGTIMGERGEGKGLCLPALRPNVFDSFHVFLSRHHFSENGVLAVEMRGGDCGDEELGAVAVWGVG